MYLYEPLGGFGSFLLLFVGVVMMLRYRKLEKEANKPIEDFKKRIKEKWDNNITLDANDPDLEEQIKTLKSIYDNVHISYSKD